MAHNKTYELSHDDLNKVMASVDIPVCPGVLTEAMSEAQKDEPDIRRLADIITADPGMSAAALKLANSPLYGSGRAVSSVRNAVERLGTKNIVCVVVASSLRASITGLPAAWLEQFWRRTSMMALAASLIARRLYGISPDAAYTYTLFHDAAIPLMMKRFPNYGEVLEKCEREGMLLEQAEAQFFPCTHPIVGSLLVRNWGLPPILGQAIRFHHEPDAYDLPDRTLPGGALSFIAVTQVAEHLLAEIQQGEDLEVGSALFERAIDYLGISPDDLDRLRQQVNAAIEDASLA
ncbi:HDOD domain-containing protein [Azonexus hydrophilus]|uniref:HDOD domain-containing protein n=1 Tax=Azonexus hydrophilus TaxID=418702 RepID=UPI0004900216|nr:HDOD domain-containing protein [Azonexus hydrophilus]